MKVAFKRSDKGEVLVEFTLHNGADVVVRKPTEHDLLHHASTYADFLASEGKPAAPAPVVDSPPPATEDVTPAFFTPPVSKKAKK